MRPSTFRFINNQSEYGDANLFPTIGGDVMIMQATASLNIGDVVQLDGVNMGGVIKATTNPGRTIGVVVGGDSNQDGSIFDFAQSTVAAEGALILTGVLAAIAGQKVWVQTKGIVFVVSDAAIGVHASISASVTTAGRVAPAVNAATIAAGAVAVTSSAANGAIISGNDFATPVIGKSIDVAAAGAGVVIRAYINIH